jgi:uncharacterized protein (TIGR00369 family)
MTTSTEEQHFRKLENMYHRAPCNQYYEPRLTVSQGKAQLVIPVKEELYHSARAVHGAAYFKAVDDAAFFAANSLVDDVFVLTTSLNCYLLGPITSGEIRAQARVVSQTKSMLLAESVVTDAEGHEIARGMGSFVRSRIRLEDVPGYHL